MNCKNCGLPIEQHERGMWYHTTLEKEVNIDGADVMVIVTSCPDDLGEAEPEDVEAKLSDISDEAIKAMDLYWEPDIERIKHFLAVAYQRGSQAVRA